MDGVVLKATLQKLRLFTLRGTIRLKTKLERHCIAIDVAKSLKHLHRAGGACGYFTTSHVVFSELDEGPPVIVNFAHSRPHDSRSVFRSHEYKPQDDLMAHQKSDIYSLGLVLYLLLGDFNEKDWEKTDEQLLSKLSLNRLSY